MNPTHVKPRTNGRIAALNDGRQLKASLSEDGEAVCYVLPATDGETITRIALTHESLAAMVMLSAHLRADAEAAQ